jgi:trigger factor
LEPGQTKTVPLAYEEGDLKGKTVDYTVTLKAVKTKVVPAADDEFAKDLGEFGSLAELRDKIRGQLESVEARRVDREVKEELVDLLVRRTSFEVPEALVARHMVARTRGAVEGLAMRGIDPRTAGVDWKQYHDGQREQSIHSAKAAILLDEIARREHVEATDEEVDHEIGHMAERMRRPKEAVRKAMEKEGEIAGLRARIREEKTLDLLKSNARMETE